MKSKLVFVGPTLRDGDATNGELPILKAVPVAPFISDGVVNEHLLVFGCSGKGKSLLIEQYRALGYEIVDVPAATVTGSRMPQAKPAPVRIDEYLTLPGDLFKDAADSVHDVLGCSMTQEGLVRFLSVSRLGAKIFWFNEVETQINDEIYHALEEFLTGTRSWITSNVDYETRMLLLRAAARARGYLEEAQP